jgi:soluble lytic murein transglycosylase
MLLLLSALASAVPNAPQPVAPPLPAAEVPDATSAVGPGYRSVSPVVSAELTTALFDKDWSTAIEVLDAIDPKQLTTRAQGERAFLLAWAHIRADTPEKAVHLLPLLESVLSVPAPYLATVRGELLVEELKHREALAALETVPPGSAIYPRAAVLRAQTLQKLDRRKEASEVFAAIVERPDPAPGNPLALLALAQQKGAGNPEAYPYLRRLWAWYPTHPEASDAAKMLSAYPDRAEFRPTTAERSIRAEQWMRASAWSNAITAANQALAGGLEKDEATCRALYVRGRSTYKKNQLSNAIQAFADAGTRCEGVSDEYGAKALYITGTAQFRKKQFEASARTFEQIPARYPNHSMADDGYTHAGIGLQEAGDLAGAQVQWQKALDELPDGDTAAEATWRLAWSQYVEGDVAGARKTALALSRLSPAVDAVHSDAGRYWHARWALYPDVDAPTVPDEAGRAEAIAGWSRLLDERPFSFYAILAASRLAEVAPEELAKRQTRGERGPIDRPWEVRTRFLEHEGIRHGVALARLGLSREARLEWDRFEDDWTPDEAAWLFEMRAAAGDWLFGHAAFRAWIRKHPVGSLGEGERAVVRVAYPDRYWDEVQKASVYDTYEPRLFHSLVREESNFNRRIVSFAGARGLSQLMPATARQTAGWMKRSVTMSDLFDPQTNLDIGGRYLHQVHKQLSGSPYCALAGYNAGPGRVNQWRGEWGNIPTDEYVERIPFRETRGYVKRVMGTWQTYRWFMDDGQPFPDLSAYNHQVLP